MPSNGKVKDDEEDNLEDYPEEEVNCYQGYEPETGVSLHVARVPANISPEDFFNNYVSKRRPVILEGHLTDPEWKGHLWTNQYLKERADQAKVIVEQRSQDTGVGFGLASPKVDMKYGEFVSNVMEGNDRLYLTTQDLERFENDVDDMGMPRAVVAEPLQSLKDDYPLKPKLLGQLVPHQLTLWHGTAKQGSSSGLHHDFHDNLYVLIRGRKRFRLFPPSAAPHMRLEGRLARIHPNGLIVYRIGKDNPAIPVRQDGVPLEYLAHQKKNEAETELSEAEMDLEEMMTSQVGEEEKERKVSRLKETIKECEERIDLAMEEMLKYVASEDEDEDDEDVVEEEAGHGTGDDCKEKRQIHDANQNRQEPLEDSELSEPAQKRAKLGNGKAEEDMAYIHRCHETPVSTECHHNHPVLPSMCQYVSSCGSGLIHPLDLKRPDHFCDIVLPTDTDVPDELFAKYGDLKEVGCIICEVKAGEMLYLPASWFHEVTSYSVEAEEQTTNAHKDKGHVALNYWAFPPDSHEFEKPYLDDFWQRRWDSIHDADGDADDEAEEEEENSIYYTRYHHTQPSTAQAPTQ